MKIEKIIQFKRTPRSVPRWDPKGTAIETVQAIFKVAERCNINCSYCYYFNGNDDSYNDRPSVAPPELSDKLASFLRAGVESLSINELQVVFHGGEPMLQRKSAFDRYCTALRQAFIGSKTSLSLSIQTNGTLISEEWLALFHEHQVSVGVSLDGPAQYNDVYRLDHKGRSTYSATIAGIHKIHAYQKSHQMSLGLGTLTVLNSAFDSGVIYDHLVDDLEIRSINFLLPDACHDDYITLGIDPAAYGQALQTLFHAWARNPVARVRIIHEVLEFFQTKNISYLPRPDKKIHSFISNAIIVIQSDGTLHIDDSLMPAGNWRNSVQPASLHDTCLKDWMATQPYSLIIETQRQLPEGCTGCAWKKLCRGGAIENRYSLARGFDNPSVFCESLKMFYQTILNYLCSNGYPLELAIARLREEAHQPTMTSDAT